MDAQFSNIVLDDTETSFDTSDLTSYNVPSGTLAQGTTYFWRVRYQDNNGAFSAFADPFSFTTTGAPLAPSRLVNISTRGQVGTGDFIMIGGFIIEGDESKTVLVTGRGPSLTQFGVPNALANPRLTLFKDAKPFALNNDWVNSPNFDQISQSPNRPTDDFEAAIYATLPPGSYTAHLAGVNDTAGVGLVEVWDEGDAQASRLGNISTRAEVGTGAFIMIGGFIIEGEESKQVLITGLGPSLSQFGVPGVLADPTLTLFSGQTQIAFNDNWPEASNADEIMDLPNRPGDTLEPAILITLAPGTYTAHLAGVNGTTGQALVEVWDESPLP